MKPRNLPDGGHDKVIVWQRPTNKTSQKRDSKTRWRRTTTTFFGAIFGTYRTRRRDVLMGCRG